LLRALPGRHRFPSGFVETFTSLFDPLGIPGAFVDPNLPAGYAPWNLQVAGSRLFITYALQDAAQHDPVSGAGNGIVDEYNLDGSFVRRFVSNGPLNVPSAIVQAGANFGAFSNDILIGNFGDGLVNAFDPNTGQFLGTLKDGNGNPIINIDLHSMTFGNGTVGDADTLFLTAALDGGANGLFASVSVNTAGTRPDFTLSPPSASATLAPGQSASFTLMATPVANFRRAFSFACNASAAVTCTVGSPSVDAVTGSATVGVTTTASSATASTPMAALALPGVLLAGLGLRRRRRSVTLLAVAIAMLTFALAGISGCGGSGGSSMQPQPVTQILSVTASAGAVSHTTVLTLNVQ
jgi:hypothetical protein